MDVNYWLEREQVERVRAFIARSEDARIAHTELADLYRARIHAYRDGAREAEPMIQAVPAEA